MLPVVNKPVEVIELPNIKPETSNLVPTVAVNLPIATLLSASAAPTLVLIKLSLPHRQLISMLILLPLH